LDESDIANTHVDRWEEP